MDRSPKLNEEVYIFTNADVSGVNICKGRICGCRKVSASFAKWLFIVETPQGNFERFALDMFESVEEIAANIKNYVVE